jgi:hypothetical protein
MPAGPCGENAERQRQPRVPLESTLHAAVDPRLSSFRASMHRKSGACWDAFHGRSASCFPRARLASFVRQAVIPPTSLRRDWASNQARQRHRDWLPSLSLLRDLAD